MRRRGRRWIGSVVVCLVSGAVATVAVSWACALWTQMPHGAFVPVTGARWPVVVPSGWPEEPHFQHRWRSAFWWEEGDLASLSTFPPPEHRAVFVWRTGWPWHALQGTQFEDGMVQTSLGSWRPKRSSSWTIDLGVPPPRWLRTYDDALPLWPVPIAFVGDTMLYGVLVAAVWGGFKRIRWVRRRGRRLCGACGYDLAGLAVGAACPECGCRG